MLSEKEIYQAWEKRFSYPLQPKVTIARTLKLSKKPLKIKSVRVLKYPVIVVGDDALNESHQKIFLEEIVSQFKGHQTLLIANRFDRNMISDLKKRKISVLLVREKKYHQQSKRFVNLVNKNLHKYKYIVVWTGHLRLSDDHFQKKIRSVHPLFIYLQSNFLRWKFPAAHGWNQITKNQIAWMGASSLITIDRFRSSNEKDFMMIQPEMASSMLIQQLRLIAKVMGQSQKYFPKKIFHIFDYANLKKINAIKNKHLKKFLIERIIQGESATIPKEKMILLSTLNASHIAEEAAHYLRTSQQQISYYGPAATVIEEALAFLASLILFPNRRIPVSDKKAETAVNSKERLWNEVHRSGYALGFQLWKAWKHSDQNKIIIRKLWRLHPGSELEAQMMFNVVAELK